MAPPNSFICDRCGHTTKTLQNLKKHLLNKTSCMPSLKDVPRECILALYHRPDLHTNQHVCKDCKKGFSHQQSLSVHRKKCQVRIRYNIPSTPFSHHNNNTLLLTPQFIYLIWLREFKNQNLPIFKVGRTSRYNFTRVNEYPKGSELLLQITCKDSVEMEKQILRRFDELFVRKAEIGREYFEGDKDRMIDIILLTMYREENT